MKDANGAGVSDRQSIADIFACFYEEVASRNLEINSGRQSGSTSTIQPIRPFTLDELQAANVCFKGRAGWRWERSDCRDGFKNGAMH